MNAATTVTTETLAAIERDSARASGWTLARHIDEVREATTSENAEVADYATALLIKLEYLVTETSVPPASITAMPANVVPIGGFAGLAVA